MSNTDSKQGEYMDTVGECLDYLIKFGDKSLVEHHINHIIGNREQQLKQKLVKTLPKKLGLREPFKTSPSNWNNELQQRIGRNQVIGDTRKAIEQVFKES